MTKNRNRRELITVIALLLVFVLFVGGLIAMVDNKTLDFENIVIDRTAGKSDGTNIKIAHLSDMHFPKIKVDLDKLVERIRYENVDLIAITGDLIHKNTEKSGVFDFIDMLKGVAPIFYVNGNHETRSKDSDALYDYMKLSNIIYLCNDSMTINIKEKPITIVGLGEDDDYSIDSFDKIDYINSTAGSFVIMLAHRPDRFEGYLEVEKMPVPNLVLSGHIHGGQIRLFGKGLLSPEIRFFPKYHSGLYFADNEVQSALVVSRGLGNSSIPFRINNYPHVPIINIKL